MRSPGASRDAAGSVMTALDPTWLFELSGHDPVDVRVRRFGPGPPMWVRVGGGGARSRAPFAGPTAPPVPARQRWFGAPEKPISPGAMAERHPCSNTSAGHERPAPCLGRRGRNLALNEKKPTGLSAAPYGPVSGGAAGWHPAAIPMPGTVLSVAGVAEGRPCQRLCQPLRVIRAIED